MTTRYLNACVWTAAGIGTGTFTVSAAVPPYFKPADCTNPAVVGGGTYNYFAINGTTEYEVGQGIYTAVGTTLSRAQIFSSSNTGSLVNFTKAPVVYMGDTLAGDPAFTANIATLAAPGNWKMMYTDGSGIQTALGVGAAGTVLSGNGVTAAPSWTTPSGSGDVLGPATNTDTYIPQWNGANSKILANGINPTTILYTTSVGSVVQAYSANLATVAAPGSWKLTYTDGLGVQTALGVGAAGTVLSGNGVTAAPSWTTPSGSGDVLGPATNHTLYIPQWNGANSKTLADGIDPTTILYTTGLGSVTQAYSANLATLAAPGNWKVAYTNGTGVQTALTVGAAGTALAGNGVTAAPSWQGVCLTANNLNDVTAATARTNLGLAIGTNVEAWSANLDTVSAPGNWKITYTNGTGVQTALTVGAAGTALAGNGITAAPTWQGVCLTANNLNDVTAATARTNLGLAIGTNVQAWDANLDTLAALGNWKVAYTNGSGNQVALTVGAAGTALCGNGVTAAPTWQAIMLPSVSANLTAGFTTTSVAVGTKSTGTFTPDPTAGNIQHYVNGGAHTLAPPSSVCTMVIQCTNASAGALTTSGFSFVTGDVYSTTGTKKHIFYITKTNDYSQLHVQYVVGT